MQPGTSLSEGVATGTAARRSALLGAGQQTDRVSAAGGKGTSTTRGQDEVTRWPSPAAFRDTEEQACPDASAHWLPPPHRPSSGASEAAALPALGAPSSLLRPTAMSPGSFLPRLAPLRTVPTNGLPLLRIHLGMGKRFL